jgi:hypothetical protein
MHVIHATRGNQLMDSTTASAVPSTRGSRVFRFIRTTAFLVILYLLSPIPAAIWCKGISRMTPPWFSDRVTAALAVFYAPISYAYNRNDRVHEFYNSYASLWESVLLSDNSD